MASLEDYIAGRASFQEAMQGVRGGPVERLSDVPQVAGPPNALAPYNPSPLDRVRNALLDAGAPRRTAEGAANLLDFLPGVGDAEGAYQAGREGAAGNVLGAAIIGGATLAGLPSGKARALADLLPSERKAQEILDLLKSGRASEVTDDMLGALDANGQAYLFENYDLPMDAASREARRSDAFNNGTLYHGGTADIPAFDARRASNAEQMNSAGVHLAESPDFAARYATGDGGVVYPVVFKGDVTDGNSLVLQGTREGDIVTDLYKGSRQKPYWSSIDGTPGGDKVTAPLGRILDNFAPRKAEKVLNKYGVGNVTYTAKFGEHAPSGRGMFVLDESPSVLARDPANIRSRFARFDPRLSHLRDLLAGLGVGTAGLYGATNALMPQQDEGAY